MTIYCKECGKYLGEIKKGNIRKGVIFICKECNESVKCDLPPGFDEIFGNLK